jgi:hypothetical protein
MKVAKQRLYSFTIVDNAKNQGREAVGRYFRDFDECADELEKVLGKRIDRLKLRSCSEKGFSQGSVTVLYQAQ